jgi:asparagine synthase (glutamine-hydrolysing)
MSGVAVIASWDAPHVDITLIDRMLDRIPHRASEGRAILSGAHCLMGYARHATTARDRAAAQPLRDTQRGLWVVADARLDNRDELRESLSRRDGRSLSDAELLLRGYERWGVELAAHLEGDFAFVIWDAGCRQVYAARDPFGVRPLYYHASRTHLALASEVEQILALDGVAWEIEDDAVLDYLRGVYRHPGKTFFRAVARIAPGHTLVARDGTARETRYWQPPREELRLARADEYHEEFRRLFELAVAARLESDRPLVAHLSGGLDSSSIACVAAEVYRREGSGRPPLRLASAVYPGLDCDETPYIDAVARLVPFPSERYLGSSWGPTEDDVFYVAYPWCESLTGVAAGWRRMAVREGARVVLSGSGGDELLFEGGLFRDLLARGRWLALLRETALAPNYAAHSQRYWLMDALRGGAPPSLRRIYRRWVPARPAPPPAWLGPRLVERWQEPVPEEPVPWAWASHTQQWTWLGMTGAHQGWSMDQEGCRAAREGIELRFPFLDVRLVRFVLAVPVEHRLPGGWMKVLLRRGLADLLPSEIAQRRGVTTFDTVVRRYVARYLEMHHGVAFDRTWACGPYVERRGVQELLNGLAGAPVESLGVDDGLTAWNILRLEMWLRQLYDVQRPTRAAPPRAVPAGFMS